MSAIATDWKAIAEALAQRVDFAMRILKAPPGSGMVGSFDDNAESVELQHWRSYFADAMEMIPGVKVDREMLPLFDLPPAKRRKAIKAHKASRTPIRPAHQQVGDGQSGTAAKLK